MFFKKVQQSYRYTKLCNYREEFVHKPISNISSILVCWNLSLTRPLNVFTFKWMHNLQKIEHCQRRKKNISCFSSSTLHAVKFLLWKKIITVSKPTALKVFFMGKSGCLTKRVNWGGGSPCGGEVSLKV